MRMELRGAFLPCLLAVLLSWNEVSDAFSSRSQQFARRRKHHIRDTNTGSLFLFFTDAKTNGGSTRNDASSDQVPFVIEKLGDSPSDFVFEEIAEMCIDVFFNEEPTTTPWKQVQLTYLRNLQQSDLCYRKTSKRSVNEMFVARRVLPVSKLSHKVALKKPLILDVDTIMNCHGYDDAANEDFVKDQVIGFVEVTEKQFGLPSTGKSNNGGKGNKQLRPVLTNLAVHPAFRKAGVGSKLLQACENAVSQNWHGHDELVLEVENDNPSALDFYARRGYSVVFEDPASRRYDVNGFFLQKKQCTKLCMRKALGKSSQGGEAGSFSFVGSNMLQSLRENVFSK